VQALHNTGQNLRNSGIRSQISAFP
jgi:hypothetical protein